MGPTTDTSGQVETVTLRYWAAAKAAAGVAEDVVPVAGPVTLADLRDRAVALHPAPGWTPCSASARCWWVTTRGFA